MKTGNVRSPLFYMGDKFKLLDQLKDRFPKKINNFIEPFTGGGSVFLNINADKYFLNDRDKYLIGIHKHLIKSSVSPNIFFKKVKKTLKKYGLSRSYEKDIIPKYLKKRFIKTYYAQFNKQGYTKLKNDYNSSKKIDYTSLYILLILGFNRILRFNSSGRFNLPVGNVDFNKNTVTALNNYFKVIKNKKVKFHNFDYKKFLNKIDFKKGDFLYCDPPYLITAGEYNKYWNENDEIDLLKKLDELNKRKIKWALSNVIEYRGKKNKILIDWSKKYKSYKIKSNYISFNDNTIKSFKEVLILNA
jgi:DNA adenine methylase